MPCDTSFYENQDYVQHAQLSTFPNYYLETWTAETMLHAIFFFVYYSFFVFCPLVFISFLFPFYFFFYYYYFKVMLIWQNDVAWHIRGTRGGHWKALKWRIVKFFFLLNIDGKTKKDNNKISGITSDIFKIKVVIS